MAESDLRPESAEPVPRWRRRRWQALAVAGAVVAVSVAGSYWLGRGGEDLPRAIPETVYELEPFAPDEATFSVGNIDIEAPGEEVQIVSVEPSRSPNLEYLGAYVVWPRDYANSALSIGGGFPSDLQPRRHALTEVIPTSETNQVDPGDGSALPFTVTVGFRVLSGVGAVNGISVTYKANGKTTSRHFSLAAVVCLRPGPCLDYEKDANADTVVLRRLGLVRD